MKIMLIRSYRGGIYSYVDKTKIYEVYNNRLVIKIINYIIRRININWIIYNKSWQKILHKCNEIIILDSVFTPELVRYIKKSNAQVKINLFYLNILNENNLYFLKSKCIDSVWTFDKKDADKYNLKFHNYFYPHIELDKNVEVYDFLFLGMKKDRGEELKYLEKILSLSDYKTCFIIIEDNKNYIKYQDYLNLISKSKVIVDWVIEGQYGLTRRPYEALFFEKKLLTNMKEIIEYDFYNSNNIFIYGVDNIKDLDLFINTSYEKIDKNIINRYSFESWLNDIGE